MSNYLWCVLAVIMAVVISISLTACGGGDDDGISSPPNQGGNGGNQPTVVRVECKYCQGTGKCYNYGTGCNGTGICKNCNGSGYLEETTSGGDSSGGGTEVVTLTLSAVIVISIHPQVHRASPITISINSAKSSNKTYSASRNHHSAVWIYG